MNRPSERFQSIFAARDEDPADRLPETAGLAIRLLGGLQVRREGQCLPRPVPTLKTASLLAFLLLHPGRSFPRSYLAGLFWPEVDEDAARGSLRTALVPIRHLLERRAAEEENHCLISLRTALQLTPPPDCWVDVWEFERRLTEAAHLPAGSEAWYRALENAVDLYRGDLLPGFDETWCGPERDRLQQRLLACLHDLATADRERKQYDRAIAWAQRAVGVDYGDEQSHRQLMLLYALRGEQPKSLQQYHDCRRYLREELGVAPDPETVHLYHWLQDRTRWERRLGGGGGALSAAERPATGAGPRVGVPQRTRPPTRAEEIVISAELTSPLVGREQERERLQEAWERACSRRGALVLLTGEAGIGKSRLGRELLQEVGIEGGLALYAPCHALEGDLLYQPVIAALRGALRLARQHALTLCDPVWLAEVARLLPELRHPARTDPAADRQAGDVGTPTPGWNEGTDLLEGMTQFLLALSAQRPLCLFFDDLQWADPATGRFLQYLTCSARQAPLLLIGAYREGEAHGNPWLRQWRSSVQTQRMAAPVTLSRLGEAEVLRLLRQLAEGKASETLIRPLSRRLYEETEGNPFFLWEQLRVLFEERWLGLDEDGHWCFAGEWLAASPLPLPDTVRQLVRQRVSRLSEEDQWLLTCAAVIGRRFTVEVLRRAAGREAECSGVDDRSVGAPEHSLAPAGADRGGVTPQSALLPMEATLTALERLVTADLIRAQLHPSVFEFSHDKIRAVLCEELLPLRRQELHRRVREALEAILGEECGGREISPTRGGRQFTLSVQ